MDFGCTARCNSASHALGTSGFGELICVTFYYLSFFFRITSISISHHQDIQYR